MRKTLPSVVVALAVLVLLPARAFAQSNSNIAGVVKDTSGAVLPGVTVEAASPALIEKVRTVVTDSAGQYKIINLRAGRVHRDLHAARLQHRQARRHRADGVVHGQRQRRPARRQPRGDDHRHRRGPDGRRPERRVAAGGHARHPRRHPDREQVGRQPRRPHSGRDRQQPGCRRQRLHVLADRHSRRARRRAAAALRRHDVQQRPGTGRSVHRHRHQRRDRAGDQPRDRRAGRGKRDERHPHQRDPEGGRQHVRRARSPAPSPTTACRATT